MTRQRVLLVTIPHTGTRFFRDILTEHLPYVGMRGIVSGGKVGVGAIHCTQSVLDAIADAEYSHTLVTTWRDPEKVARSWLRRGKPLEELDDYRARWGGMVRRWRPRFLTLEEDRERKLAELGAYLGLDLTTDWEPVTDV